MPRKLPVFCKHCQGDETYFSEPLNPESESLSFASRTSLTESRPHHTILWLCVRSGSNDFNCKRNLLQARSFSLDFNPLWSVHLFFQQGGIISLQEINGITIVGPPPQRVFGHPSLVFINYVMKVFFIFISEIIILIKLVIIVFILAIEGTW